MDKTKFNRLDSKLKAIAKRQQDLCIDDKGKAYIETRKGHVIRRRPTKQ